MVYRQHAASFKFSCFLELADNRRIYYDFIIFGQVLADLLLNGNILNKISSS